MRGIVEKSNVVADVAGAFPVDPTAPTTRAGRNGVGGPSQAGPERPVSARVHMSSVWVVRTVSLVAVLSTWEWVVRSGIVQEFFLAPPSAIVALGFDMVRTGEIWPDVWTTGQEVAAGLGIGILVGVPVGIAAGISRLFWHSIEPYVMAMYSIPSVAFLPLMIIWLGTGMAQKILLVTLGAVFPIIIATQAGAASVDKSLTETARSFLAGPLQIVTRVTFPASVPAIIAGLRIAVGRGLIMAVVAEFYSASQGLGYMIFRAGSSFDTVRLFVGVVILAMAGALLSALLNFVHRRVAPWAHQDT